MRIDKNLNKTKYLDVNVEIWDKGILKYNKFSM